MMIELSNYVRFIFWCWICWCIQLEYAHYLEDPDTDLSMLNKYPNVKNVFMKFNTLIPSSGSVERLFSFGGLIHTARRNRLSDKSFEMLLLLKANATVFKWTLAFRLIAHKLEGCILQYCSCVVPFLSVETITVGISRYYNKTVEKREKYFVFEKYIWQVFCILYFAVSHKVFERKYLKYIFEKYFSILYLKYILKVFYTTLLID